jgi:hypothetical protein
MSRPWVGFSLSHFKKKQKISRVWWHTSIIPTLERVKQEDNLDKHETFSQKK